MSVESVESVRKVVSISNAGARNVTLYVYYKMPLRPETVGTGLAIRLASLRNGTFFGIDWRPPGDTGHRKLVDTSKNPEMRFNIMNVFEVSRLSLEKFASLLDVLDPDALPEKFALVLTPFDVSGVYLAIEAFKAALPIRPCRWAAYAVYKGGLTSFIEGT